MDTNSRKDELKKRIESLEKEIEDAQDMRFEFKKELTKLRAKEIEESMHENNQQLLKG